MRKTTWFERRRMARSDYTTVREQLILSTDTDSNIRQSVASNSKFRSVQLALTNDPDYYVLKALAKNHFIHHDVQMILKSFRTKIVRELAGNWSLSPEIQITLATHHSARVVKALAKNKSLCDEARALIAMDKRESVQNALRKWGVK